jgi:hypothetical protein
MPAESSHGTFRLGSWEPAEGADVMRWVSHPEDPYNGILISGIMASRIRTDFTENARTMCEKFWYRGVSIALDNGTAADSYNMLIALAAERDPNFNEQLRAEYARKGWHEAAFKIIIESYHLAVAETDRKYFLCVNPGCHRIHRMDNQSQDKAHQCPNCGCTTMVHEDMLGVDVGPNLIPAVFYNRRMDRLKRMLDTYNKIFEIAELTNGVWVPTYNASGGRGFGIMTREAPNLKPSGDHWIRARANIESFSVHTALRRMQQGTYYYLFISADEIGNMMNNNALAPLMDLMVRYSKDPTKILEEARADSLRRIYITEKWRDRDGRPKFIEELQNREIIRPDLSVSTLKNFYPMIDMVFNSTANSSKIKVVITRTGDVNFKHSEVADRVTKQAVFLAKELTEMQRNPEEIFRLSKLR